MMVKVKIAGAILAGGQSSRMGEDKATLCFKGETLLNKMENILQDSGISNIFISHNDKISDKIPKLGPLSGIHAILKELSPHYSHVIFIPIDMPCISTIAIKQLLSAPTEYPLVRFKNHTFPFRLQVDEKWINLAEDMLQKKDDTSIRTFQKHINCFELDVLFIPPSSFTNINTPKDWNNYIGKKAI